MSNEDFKITRAMIQYGGSFVSELGSLARLADDYNLQKIKETWPYYWAEYKEIASKHDLPVQGM